MANSTYLRDKLRNQSDLSQTKSRVAVSASTSTDKPQPQGSTNSMAGKAKFAGMGAPSRKATTGMADSVKKPKFGAKPASGGIKSAMSQKGC